MAGIPRLNLPRQGAFEGPAAIWKRVVAFFIDLFIIDLVLFWPFNQIVRKAMPIEIDSLSAMKAFFSSSPNITGTLAIASIAMGILAVLYFVLMEYRLGQTIGKMLLKINVISEVKDKTKGKKPAFWQCLLRSIIWLPIFPFIVFWVIDPLYALFNQKNQRLLEYISKTMTVETYEGLYRA